MKILNAKNIRCVFVVLFVFTIGMYFGIWLPSQGELERNHEIRRSLEKSWKSSRAKAELNLNSEMNQLIDEPFDKKSQSENTSLKNVLILNEEYHNNVWGFSFEYPVVYEVKEPLYDSSFTVFNTGVVPQGEQYEDVLITVSKNEAFEKEMREMIATGTITAVLLSGRHAWYGQLDSNFYSSDLDTLNYYVPFPDNHWLHISSRMRDKELFDLVTQTISFFEPTQVTHSIESIQHENNTVSTSSELVWYGNIKSLRKNDGQQFLKIDKKIFLQNHAARESHIRQGQCRQTSPLHCVVYNDYTVEDKSPSDIWLPLSSDADIEVLYPVNRIGPATPRRKSPEELVSLYERNERWIHAYFHFTIENGVITNMREQYLP